DEVDAALAAWGAYDRDDPFPIFAGVRARGPAHRVTLADGHSAWLVVDYDHARAALNDLRFSKNMQAAFAADDNVLAEGLPAPEDRPRLGRELTVLLAPTPTPETWDRAKEASDAVVSMLAALVEQKKADPEDDLVSALVTARDESGRLTQPELLATIFQLIVA